MALSGLFDRLAARPLLGVKQTSLPTVQPMLIYDALESS